MLTCFNIVRIITLFSIVLAAISKTITNKNLQYSWYSEADARWKAKAKHYLKRYTKQTVLQPRLHIQIVYTSQYT